MDRWDALALFGVNCLGMGVWLRFGPPWALMLVGAIALGLACYREAKVGRKHGPAR